MKKRGHELWVKRIPNASGYIWEGFFEEVPEGTSYADGAIRAVPLGRERRVFRGGGLYSASVVWLDIGGYLVL